MSKTKVYRFSSREMRSEYGLNVSCIQSFSRNFTSEIRLIISIVGKIDEINLPIYWKQIGSD